MGKAITGKVSFVMWYSFWNLYSAKTREQLYLPQTKTVSLTFGDHFEPKVFHMLRLVNKMNWVL